MQISVRAAAKVLVVVLTKYGNGFVFPKPGENGKRFLDPSRKREHLLTRSETKSPCLTPYFFSLNKSRIANSFPARRQSLFTHKVEESSKLAFENASAMTGGWSSHSNTP
ncbi:hypothetical protein CDAR_424841 [Caerostris darwini]|uniref:Secreted protein n=1 Tax=Caerostris darwini TaxID=1538125 RepID=A0AAV4U1K7_9ARAC|nr:hypothetical protein CDAR_424841 [Caerostris darwini]